MKILIVGSKFKYSLAQSYKRAFDSLSCKTHIFDIREAYEDLNLVNKITHRLFWKWLGGLVQNHLINVIKKHQPDFILVFKGWLIKPKTLNKIKNKFPEIKLFNFNPDNPFNTWHHGNSNVWIRKSIPLYDSYFIWGEFLISKLYKSGAQNVHYLPFGYEKEIHRPVDVSNRDQDYYGSDLSFIGSWDRERESILSNLVDFDLKIWGNDWNKASKKVRYRWQKKAVYGEEFSKVVNASKINLNLIRRQNESSHNMRTFEIPACKGFMLSTRTKEQSEFFQEEKEVDYFSDLKELKNKINYYIKNSDVAEKVAESGHETLLKQGYRYKDRAEEILEIFKK